MAIRQGLIGDITSALPGTVFQILQNPPDGSSSFSTFLNLTSQSEHVAQILARGDVTVLAPDDQAFSLFTQQADANQLPNILSGNVIIDDGWSLHVENLLLYHFLPSKFFIADLPKSIVALNGEKIYIDDNGDGSSVTFNEVVRVTEADIVARKSVIQAVDNVLAPAWMNMTIFDVAMTDDWGNFSTFINLAEWTGLSELLSSPPNSFNGPYTVFLPTNEAFEQLAVELGTNLTNLDKGYVTDILLYHIVFGIRAAKHFTVGVELKTLLEFHSLVVTSPLDMIGVSALINDAAPILQTDVLANNGVVQILSGVLMPDIVDPYMENCSSRQNIEETFGSQSQSQSQSQSIPEVVCNCYRASGRDIRNVILTCSEMFHSNVNTYNSSVGTPGDGTDAVDRTGNETDDSPAVSLSIPCTPRDLACTHAYQCCSAPLRQCTDGVCVDATNSTLENGGDGDSSSKLSLKIGDDNGFTGSSSRTVNGSGRIRGRQI